MTRAAVLRGDAGSTASPRGCDFSHQCLGDGPASRAPKARIMASSGVALEEARWKGMDDIERIYLDAVRASVQVVAERFTSDPASFLYESDLRGLLFAQLFNGLADAVLPWRPEETGLLGVPVRGLSLHVNPVKSEYTYGDVAARDRFDIAVLARKLRPGSNAWNQHVRIGVEIKLWQADGSGGGFHDDIGKLKRYAACANQEGRRFTGLCLVFCHLREGSGIEVEVTAGNITLNPTSPSPPVEDVVAWAFTP